MKVIACPSCAAPMERRLLARKPHGQVELDVCFGCNAIWFDQFESAALTPGAVLELFEAIHQNHDQPPRPLADVTRCPACRANLALTHDIQRTNRITYYRCPAAHGRLTTFFQFLREKSFVRSLTPVEVRQLQAHVRQVRCSGCGAPVDLGRDAQCGYCRAPISILDADAVRRTIAELGAAERERALLDARVDPTAIVDGLLAGKRFERKLARIGTGASLPDWNRGAVDLVGEALDFLMS